MSIKESPATKQEIFSVTLYLLQVHSFYVAGHVHTVKKLTRTSYYLLRIKENSKKKHDDNLTPG